jgi:integrase
MTLPLSMRRFLNEQRLCCKASTVAANRSALRSFCRFLCREFCADRAMQSHIALIDRSLLDRYLDDLHRQNLAPYSQVQQFLIVRKFLAREIDRRTLAASLLRGFDRSRLPVVPDYLPRPLSRETDRLLLDRLRASDDRSAQAFLLLRLTGLRISELINLSPDCTVTTARNETFLKVPLGKMNNERLVPLCDEAIDIIGKLKTSQAPGPRDPGRLIGFKGPVHNVYWRLAVQFKRFTADITDQNRSITFHRLRHTYATSLMSGGVSIVSIMKLLGHRRIEMSLRYAQVTPTHLRREYLAALDALELQYRPEADRQLRRGPTLMAPGDLLSHIAAAIAKGDAIPAPSKKILARRIARLATALRALPIPQKIPILHAQAHDPMGR